LDALIQEMRQGASNDKRLDAYISDVESSLRNHARQVAENGGSDSQWEARRLTERAAIALQASLLRRHAPSGVAEAFCQTRLLGDYGRTFGTLPKGTPAQAILDRFCKNL
jgi:putative acyl-CoA dehydrogenase